MEEWRDIPGYEGRYQASSYGRIKRLSMTLKSTSKAGRDFYYTLPERIAKGRKDKDGYLTIVLRDSVGVQCAKKIHRLVATTFIPNPKNLPQVNHKNSNKADNRIDNLEWCSSQYNLYHAHHLSPNQKNYYNQKQVAKINSKGEIIVVYKSLKYAALIENTSKQNLRLHILRNTKFNDHYFTYFNS